MHILQTYNFFNVQFHYWTIFNCEISQMNNFLNANQFLKFSNVPPSATLQMQNT